MFKTKNIANMAQYNLCVMSYTCMYENKLHVCMKISFMYENKLFHVVKCHSFRHIYDMKHCIQDNLE